MSILSSFPLSVGNNVEMNSISPTFSTLIAPLETQLSHLTSLVSRSNRPLEFTFAHQVHALVYYHTEALPPVKICCKRPKPTPSSVP